ncbi:putative disease resistance protein At3g14460 [Arachis ipaensis]|uniref:NB-ARC domain-containing protein n=1 Tax=Arachis hypogaea TaxID=3818 RepID=A0A445A706_ARAHY|nr:putative disease resistance protein At3g14460 [Arachis ipaensis]XP_025642939.1 putative disease resistance protein At3g14460 [Arachis hypogaea]QHN99735.1 Putative disease resistance protein [Arachis hypogaea]RYR22227.1 hypothetical protein Ahy_B03g067503 [Arachis hypogaea]
MGRALLSSLLHDLMDNLLYLTSQTKHFMMKPHKYQRKLMDKLLILDALVDDAEQKQFTEGSNAQAVKGWLNELLHASYQLEELLMQIMATIKSPHSQGQQFFKVITTTKKPDKYIKARISESLENLESLVKKKDVLGLTEHATWRESLQGLPSSSDVLDNYFYGNYPKDYFYGREEEEKSILENLLSASESDEHIKVINIVGKSGEGKTALADVVYFNHKVRESFELRAWITVPYKATATFIAKKILQAVTEEFVAGEDFDILWKRLQESLDGKKFLLVLDDIRIEDELHKWSKLIASLESSAAKGSSIILTSSPHDDPKLLMLPANHDVHVSLLSIDNCWSIFLVHAFGQIDLHQHPELAAVGKEIVNKLGNLPLAAKMIGSLLQDKLHINQWVQILRSELLDAGDVDLPIPSFLVLCYLDLTAQLKRCFAYLSLFPKGYEFKQKEVILLWMAQGFLNDSDSKSNGKSMEDIGDEYFGYLIMRSFLQPFGSGVSFIMHNLVHDLASYAFGESYKHHLSYSRSTEDFPELSFYKHGELSRTILPIYLPLEGAPRWFDSSLLEQIIVKVNPHVFRVLSLSHYDITHLPASIGRLSCLSYLDLSHTALQTLPDSICDLLSLQTLRLTNCTSLTSLPKRICNLVNLRYLDVRDSGLQEMPLEMHKLTSLRALTDFIVSKYVPRFGDLAGLYNLKTLTISKLENVVYAKNASDAKLKEKKSLHELMLQWSNGKHSNGNEMEVLESLEPHKDLKRLTVEYYNGASFPNWLGDKSYWDLQLVDLRHCENCNSLPTLGMLPFLKDLFIEGFTQVSSIGAEFYGVATASQKPFQSLERLQFQDMLEWKQWSILEGIEFPCLVELYIKRCPKLVRDLPKQVLSLEKLEIFGCYALEAPLPKVSDTCQVFVHDSNDIVMRNIAKTHSQPSLRRVKISEEVHEITMQSFSGFPSTKYTVGSSLGEIEEIAHEERMESESTRSRWPLDSSSSDTLRIPKLKETSPRIISHQVEAKIPNIKQQKDPQSSDTKFDTPITTQAAIKVETSSSKEDLDDQRSSFEMLKISTVSQLKSLPTKLHSLKVEGCESLEALPNDLLEGITTLEDLYLISCSSLRSLPSLGSVTTLYIRNCRRLENLPSLESRKQLACLHHLFIGSSCDSLTSLTLDLFPKLKILCIWDCPNLQSFNVTKEYKGDLPSLESLEIRDCPRLMSFPEGGIHAPNLESIFLSNCKNLNNLPDAMNSLTSIKTLFLHKCPEIESFPYGGLPSSLILLSIAYCDKLTPQKNWRLDTLESLNRLELEGGCMGMDSFPEDMILPPNINSLCISTLKSLKKLNYSGFQHLDALQTLEIHCCGMLCSLPDQGLPSSLNQLCVQECPLLTPRLKPNSGKEWHKVARIPHIQIDHQILYLGNQCQS